MTSTVEIFISICSLDIETAVLSLLECRVPIIQFLIYVLQLENYINQNQMNNDQQVKKLLKQMFDPQQFNSETSLQKLNNYGGILCLINDLKTCHRRGLSTNISQLETRAQLFGKNKQPHGESIFKKSLFQQRDFIVNLLFYLLTLRICVKLLLFRDQLLGHHPLGDQQYHLVINTQLISFILLIIMVLMKAKVSIDYYKMDQDERKYKNQRFIVKRDGEKQQILEQNIMVGDILVIENNKVIRIDGILTKSKNLKVSQAQTILKQDVKTKHQIWTYMSSDNKFEKNKDPFILAGSCVIGGYGEVLVCTVGSNCSFRYDKENKGYYSQYTPTIALIKKYMNYIQQICKTVSLVLATFISIIYLFQRYYDQSKDLYWTDLLYILRVYCGYIGVLCFIQRLKIIKSLQFFTQANRSQKQYRIRNKGSFQYLSKLDMIFIQIDTLAMRKIQCRDQINIQLDHIVEISNINNFCQVKIISNENREQIMKIFGNDISHFHIFQPDEDIPYSSHVRSLVQATFITQTPINTFINQYLPIFRALKFQVGYLYDSSIRLNREISPQIFQINFQKLIFNQIEAQYLKMNEDTNQNSVQSLGAPAFWLKIQNKLFMQDILQKLFIKANVYADLYNAFLTLYVNSILIFLILNWFSTMITVINLSWHLMIIISHRFMFMDIYKRITLITSYDVKFEKRSHIISCIKFNAILLPYYFFVANRIRLLSSLFVFFLANGLLRTEIVLNQIKPLSKKIFYTRVIIYLGICLLVWLIVVITQWNNSQLFYQKIYNGQYTFGLFLIYVSYAYFM